MAIYPELAEKFEKLQDDLEKAIAEQRQAFNYRIERGRVVFEKERSCACTGRCARAC